ncbi:uncharacterized protein LOC105160485 [Sesamum indicum]|uniref:Uncharacterized protein LOC105160485 n=1 Tax=Sesamum indicum TaxID=4182 RepID=A0A6I9T6Z1_SESIN|nr:uncharacterized protein LOC105160485 [Sesamum indicum]
MALSMNIATANTLKLNFPTKQVIFPCNNSTKPPHCIPVQQQVDPGIMCECCSGRGWLLCEFCKGQKVNVKSESNRIYRRCPSCRAIGSVLCSKCKVYKCVTFPDQTDGEEFTF